MLNVNVNKSEESEYEAKEKQMKNNGKRNCNGKKVVRQ